MKALLLACLVLSFPIIAIADSKPDTKGPKWQTNLDEALKNAESDAKLFIYVYTTWCGACVDMERDVFSDPEVIDFMEKNFVLVKLDGDKKANGKWMDTFKITYYPTTFMLDAKLRQLVSPQGQLWKEGLLAKCKTALSVSDPPTIPQDYYKWVPKDLSIQLTLKEATEAAQKQKKFLVLGLFRDPLDPPDWRKETLLHPEVSKAVKEKAILIILSERDYAWERRKHQKSESEKFPRGFDYYPAFVYAGFVIYRHDGLFLDIVTPRGMTISAVVEPNTFLSTMDGSSSFMRLRYLEDNNPSAAIAMQLCYEWELRELYSMAQEVLRRALDRAPSIGDQGALSLRLADSYLTASRSSEAKLAYEKIIATENMKLFHQAAERGLKILADYDSQRKAYEEKEKAKKVAS